MKPVPLRPTSGPCLLAGVLVTTSVLVGSFVPTLRLAAGVLALSCVVLALWGLRPGRGPLTEPAWGSALVLVGSSYLGLVCVAFAGTTPLTVTFLLLLLVSATAVGGGLPYSLATRLAAGTFPLAAAVLLLLTVSGHPLDTDVSVFLHDGTESLLHGANPYAITYPNIYDADATTSFYGEGVVRDGRVVYGFPYPPVVLLLAVPAQLFGDARYAGIVMVCAATALMLARARSGRARVAAAMLLAAPGLGNLVTPGYVEPMVVALLALVVVLVDSKHYALAAVAVGLLFVSKQYFVVLAPCLWLLRHHATPRRVALLVGTAVLTTVPALLWDPQAFWRAVVEFQFVQPFRPDSISLYVSAANAFSWPADSPAGSLGLAIGLLTAVVLTIYLRPGPASFAFAIGVALTMTVLFSKQGFLNYYYLCGSALLVAAWSVAQRDARPAADRVDDARESVPPEPETVQVRTAQTQVCRPLG